MRLELRFAGKNLKSLATPTIDSNELIISEKWEKNEKNIREYERLSSGSDFFGQTDYRP